MTGSASLLITASSAGCVALLLRGWTRSLAGSDSRWLRSWIVVPLAAAGGLGAAALAESYAELLGFSLLALGCALLVVIDLAVYRLPDVIVGPLYPMLFLALTAAAASSGDWSRLGRAAATAGGLVLCYLLLALIAPSNLGLGDVKLSGLLGAFLGWLGWSQTLLGTLAAFVLSGLFALILVVTTRATRRTSFAFGPLMVAGAVLGAAYGAGLLGSAR